MPKLKYKKKDKVEKKKHKKKRKHHKHQYYSPPILYEEEENSLPSSQAIKKDEEEWRQKLFDAMIDDEQDPYTSFYSEPLKPTRNENDIQQMTDEEYRSYIQRGIYEKKHAKEINEKKQRQKEKEKKEKEKEKQRKQLEQDIEKERQRYQLVLEKEKTLLYEKAYQHYCFLWSQLLNHTNDEKETSSFILTKKSIPWPSVDHHRITFHHVQLFISHFIKSKKQFRQEQLKYHPDKFIPKIKPYFLKGADNDLNWIIQKNNEVSGWLNQLWLEYKDKLD